MKCKALLFGAVLAASLVVVSPVQAHDDFDYPLGLMSGLLLGIHLDGHDHYRDNRRPIYRHREYRRNDSYGYQHHDRYRHDNGRHWIDKRHHRRH